MELRVVRTADLSGEELSQLRSLFVDAFGASFSEDDWTHALGGWHVVAVDGGVVAHAAVVERVLEIGSRPFLTGYVEAVATTPSRQRRGVGSVVMQRVNQVVRQTFELGALSTNRHGFYERVGWERWQGPTFVKLGNRIIRTPDEDEGVMVLRFGPSAQVGLTEPISCEARTGDDW